MKREIDSANALALLVEDPSSGRAGENSGPDEPSSGLVSAELRVATVPL